MARFGAYSNVMPVLSNEVESKFSERSDANYDLRSHEWANRVGRALKEASFFGAPVSVHNPQENQTAKNKSSR